jgi:hypothetical protein
MYVYDDIVNTTLQTIAFASGTTALQEIANTSGINVNTTAISTNTAAGSFSNVTSSGSHTIKSSAGSLQKIIICDPTAANTITMFDSLVSAGVKIGTLVISSGVNPYDVSIGANYVSGLTVSGLTNNNFTVVYK